jgi:hypothetical protein
MDIMNLLIGNARRGFEMKSQFDDIVFLKSLLRVSGVDGSLQNNIARHAHLRTTAANVLAVRFAYSVLLACCFLTLPGLL